MIWGASPLDYTSWIADFEKVAAALLSVSFADEDLGLRAGRKSRSAQDAQGSLR